MSNGGLLLTLVVMFIGLAGVLLPVIPGVALIWAAGLVWALQEDGSGRWVTFTLMTLLALIGGIAKYLIATKRVTAEAPSKRTLLLGLLGAVLGFFALPFFGILIGSVLGVYIGEIIRMQSASRAWWTTKRMIAGLGWGILAEFAAGSMMIFLWAFHAIFLNRVMG